METVVKFKGQDVVIEGRGRVLDAIKQGLDEIGGYVDDAEELMALANEEESCKYRLVEIGNLYEPRLVDIDEAIGLYWADVNDEMFKNAPDVLSRYFDYEAYGRDVRLEGGQEYWTVRKYALADNGTKLNEYELFDESSIGAVWMLEEC